MALSPENASTARSRFTSGRSRTYSSAEVNTLMDAARAQGRASLEEEIRRLRGGLVVTRSTLRSLQPALNVMAREVMDDIIRDQIDALLATPGERENG